MKQGSVVTVINAGGWAGGCSICRTEAMTAERDRYRAALVIIQQWDQLNPATSGDMPWLKQLVDDALAPLNEGGDT
jgi:hypothetical protein